MNNVTNCDVKIKMVLQSIADSDLSSTARLVAVLEAFGITDRVEVEALTASKSSTVREAVRALKIQRQKSITAENPAPEIQRAAGNPSLSAGNPAEAPEIQRQKSSDLACAYIDLTSKIINTSKVSEEKKEIISQKSASKPKAASPRGARLENDWQLPDDWRQWARVSFPATTAEQIQNEADTFVDYWRGVPGAKGCKLDWLGTWRNWCRRNFARGPMRPGAFNGHTPKKTGFYRPSISELAQAAHELELEL